MPTKTEPALTTITEAMWPLVHLIRETSFTRRQRLAPILLKMFTSELEVEVSIDHPRQGADGLRDKAEDFIDALHDLLGGEDHHEALDVVSDLIEALDRVSYRALVSSS